MAKKDKDIQSDNLDDILGTDSMLDEPEEKGGIGSIIILILIILVWLGIFAALIKFDVMGFGSKVMAPVIKNVPVLNKLLPEDVAKENGADDIPYKSIAECATYISKLESEIADYQQQLSDKDTQIADLQSEVARLKVFEDNQAEFEKLKTQFYEEVVFGDKALSYEEYIKYYKEIDPENAEKLYQQAINKYVYSEEVKERAKYYSSMKETAAAAIFCEMTGDMDIVCQLLESMSPESSGKIIAAISDIDPTYAAKLTKKLMPQE